MSPALLRRLAGAYLLVQGAGVVAWWIVLALAPAARAPFRAATAPDATLLAFAVGDLLMVGVLSVLTGVGVLRRWRWAGPALLVHASACVYAGLYCLSLPLLGDGSGWAAALGMVPVLAVPPLIVLAWFGGLLTPAAPAALAEVTMPSSRELP